MTLCNLSDTDGGEVSFQYSHKASTWQPLSTEIWLTCEASYSARSTETRASTWHLDQSQGMLYCDYEDGLVS